MRLGAVFRNGARNVDNFGGSRGGGIYSTLTTTDGEMGPTAKGQRKESPVHNNAQGGARHEKQGK